MEFTGRYFCVFSCQNWEGGLSGVPGLEAHGGYTFCGTAALVILGKEHMLDLKSLLVRKLDILLVCFSLFFEVLMQARTPLMLNIYITIERAVIVALNGGFVLYWGEIFEARMRI